MLGRAFDNAAAPKRDGCIANGSRLRLSWGRGKIREATMIFTNRCSHTGVSQFLYDRRAFSLRWFCRRERSA
jgi:hypothetical protein